MYELLLSLVLLYADVCCDDDICSMSHGSTEGVGPCWSYVCVRERKEKEVDSFTLGIQ